MPIDISYNGSSIYTSSSGTDVKLLTSGKFMEDDVLVSIPVGTEGTPTATKGTVTSNSVAVTPSVTNSEGYISGGNHTGTAVTVSASELVSGTKNITASGTTDVTNYASASVAAGSVATPATSITANPSISVSSGGLITASVSTSQSVTPTVSAGYVSSGTSGTVSVSGSDTEQLTTQAAQTIHPSTTDQTIASGKYLTGTQTVKGVLLTNLTAGNIKKDVVVKVGDSTDDDCVTSVTGTYEGGGGGVTYEPKNDGKTHLWFRILSDTSRAVCIPLSTSTDVDWGDGTVETLSYGLKWHTYSQNGLYDVTVNKKLTSYINQGLACYKGMCQLEAAEIAHASGSANMWSGCSGLKWLYYHDGTMDGSGSSWYYTYHQYCYALQYCRLDSNLSFFGEYMFDNCWALSNAPMPSALTEIPAYAFRYGRSLISVTIPARVTSIGNSAFQYCSNVTEYHIKPTSPPTLGSNSFYASTNTVFYVPSASLNTYKTATGWSAYANKMQGE